MADSIMTHAILQGELVLMVNTTRSPYDLHRVNDPFLTEFTNTLNDAKQGNSAAIFAAGDQVGAQDRVEEARGKIVALLRNGYYFLLAVPEEDLPAADRDDALTSYGWEQGQLGDLTTVDRIEALAGLAVSAGPQLPVAARYPASVVSRINNWLGVLGANKSIAGGGTRMTVIDAKDEQRAALLAKLARVRFLYCFASDAGEGNPELARIGFQSKRAAGDAQSEPLPDAPGTAVWDAAARTLTVPDVPAHASFVVAWRQVLGGQAEEAGVSTTATVSASQFSPFLPGAVYDVWVTGRNSRGDGTASNKVRWTAT